VLLDIGADVGAIVVEMPSEMVGAEIEVRPAAGDGGGHLTDRPHAHHPHVAVVDRRTSEGTVPSLVFSELPEGTHELVEKGGGPVRATATVTGSEVTQLSWPR
jgi:hypothetical protein